MPLRGSLKQCVEAAISRFEHGQADTAIITNRPAAKYYTLYHPSEYDAKLINLPHTPERIVLACTGGELASIIGTAQMRLDLKG